MANDQTTAKEVRHEVIDAADAIKDYTVDKRDEAAAKAKAALDSIDGRIETMQARIEKKWGRMDAAAREKARQSLRALQRERVEVAEWYGGLKNSSAAAWEHTKAGFSKAYRALRTGWEKAEQEYADDSKQ
ncbi:hypothetical protein J5J83_05195 [Azoarcus sp. L1K30]|uniref:hypothetical protein n=1 Tax=Azoarcus sp. L1K30 TaxID=2820277 RepID=UPI001B83921E|nr:hypothetical protein [Azoarcus sp. L1K30]MBR0565513.1 hypothetical protein [Azoarcus sp. L1K30]